MALGGKRCDHMGEAVHAVLHPEVVGINAQRIPAGFQASENEASEEDGVRQGTEIEPGHTKPGAWDPRGPGVGTGPRSWAWRGARSKMEARGSQNKGGLSVIAAASRGNDAHRPPLEAT